MANKDDYNDDNSRNHAYTACSLCRRDKEQQCSTDAELDCELSRGS